MPTLIINDEAVRRLLPMAECIEVMEVALRTLAGGDAVQPLRMLMRLPQTSSLLGMMPGYLGRPEVMGIKVIAFVPANQGTELDTHQGAVLLFDTANGQLLGVLDATEITGIRTAAVSAVATRHLARADAGDLAILGSGTQAETHLEAILLVRPVKRVRVWSHIQENAQRFARRASSRHGLEVEPIKTVREAVRGADIICTVTAAREPILCGQWISPGAHINAVGACLPTARELDTEAVERARLFVDRRESALNESGDLLIPRSEGRLCDDHILGELGEVVSGEVTGRSTDDEITLFESLGLAIEDLAAARHILEKAAAEKTPMSVELGGRRREAP